jgi:predicted transcriptional regulator
MEKHYLYVLECEQYYKIGRTNNLKNRFTAIRTANPFEVKLIICIFSYDKNIIHILEQQLHRQYMSIRHRNEWFQKNDKIIKSVNLKVNDKDFFLFQNFEKFYYGVDSLNLKQDNVILNNWLDIQKLSKHLNKSESTSKRIAAFLSTIKPEAVKREGKKIFVCIDYLDLYEKNKNLAKTEIINHTEKKLETKKKNKFSSFFYNIFR